MGCARKALESRDPTKTASMQTMERGGARHLTHCCRKATGFKPRRGGVQLVERKCTRKAGVQTMQRFRALAHHRHQKGQGVGCTLKAQCSRQQGCLQWGAMCFGLRMAYSGPPSRAFAQHASTFLPQTPQRCVALRNCGLNQARKHCSAHVSSLAARAMSVRERKEQSNKAVGCLKHPCSSCTMCFCARHWS